MRVHSLHIYPVKSGRAVDLNESAVEKRGFAHDRRWMIIDANSRFISQREQPKLALIKAQVTAEGLFLSAPQMQDLRLATPDNEASPLAVTLWKNAIKAHNASDAAHQWLSAFLGVPCQLVFQGDLPNPVSQDWGKPGDTNSFADGFPLLITTTASLNDLNNRMEKDIPMSRFRPNIVVECDEPWAEDNWHHIRIGNIDIDIVKPCTRCVVTTIDQETGEKTGSDPLATLKNFRLVKRPGLTGVIFGQNAIPRTSGIIKISDQVTVIQ